MPDRRRRRRGSGPCRSPAPRGWGAALAVSAVVLAVAACTPLPPGNYGQEEGRSRPPLSPPWFGGYLDVTLTPSLRLQDLPPNGTVTTVLSFIGAHPKKPCEPSWDGFYTLEEASRRIDLAGQLKSFRAAGNSAAISFGGQLGKELAGACATEEALVAAYSTVISKYGVDTVDFDVEGDGLKDAAAAARRGAAVARLQAGRPADHPLKVWLTLPVSSEGLTSDGEKTVAAMLDAGVDLTGVNIMVMDFEPLDPGRTMFDAAVSAAEATHRSLSRLYGAAGEQLDSGQVWHRIGLTPMIGENDVKGQVFSLADAERLNSFAVERGIGRVSMWSLNRDAACGAGAQRQAGSAAANNCSGVKQEAGQYARLLGKTLTV